MKRISLHISCRGSFRNYVDKFWVFLITYFKFSFSKLRQPTGQRQSNVRTQQKKINWANLILMLIGKSGIIKFEFQTT